MAQLDGGRGVATAYWILWITLLALLLIPGPCRVAGKSVTDPAEVSALLAVKGRLTGPPGFLKSWGDDDPCNPEWEGLECYNQTASDGYMHILALHLLNLNLSGTLAPELGQLSQLEIMDFMWNNINGSIPREIGNISTLKLLLLNGNQLSGSLPIEIGLLSKLDRLQIDENYISGPIPSSFANLKEVRHLHMNNNSLNGAIPPEICTLPNLVHFLVDNNNLSGFLPPEFSMSQSLIIIQLDNNNFSGSSIPDSYGNITSLVKLSLRNCRLSGAIPDFSMIANLTYLDLSWNQLEGSIPANRLSRNMTTIDFSNNNLNGSIPENFSELPVLQKLSLKNNQLSGSIPFIWENMTFTSNGSLILDFENNSLLNISHPISLPSNVTIMLRGNPVCNKENQGDLFKYCGSDTKETTAGGSSNPLGFCREACPTELSYEYIPASPEPCACAAPIRIGYRLKSPAFSDFLPYKELFQDYLCHDIHLIRYQLYIDSFSWEEGPRLRMYLKLFPDTGTGSVFNDSEVRRIRDLFAGWKIRNQDIIGPYELLNFTLLGPYSHLKFDSSTRWNKNLTGVILGIFAGCVLLSVVISVIIRRSYLASRRHSLSLSGVKIEGVKRFSFKEVTQATDNFSDSTQVGQGGYGKVYKGILSDGTVVAIKRAQDGSLQGSKEFCNEIQFLSRLHHRNLVSLIGYCDEEYEQMLVYEFMQNGTLRDHLSSKSKRTLDFPMRLRIALGSSKGILYLHTEANPPIFHRDIKASNILLDCKFTAKVADFGLSRLAPEPNDDGLVHGHVSTVVKGTPGYLDPEYFLTRKLTNKSDVYSLGVVFLELLTGMPPISLGRNIVREARMAHQKGRISSIVDPRLESCPLDCAVKFATLAIRCCDENTDSRPSMSEVVYELEAIQKMIPEADITPSLSILTDSLPQSQPVSGDLCSQSQPVSGDLCSSLSHTSSYSQSGGISSLRPR